MNILIINHYAGSQSHGMEFRPFYLAQEWLKKGHKVMIVGASFSHLRSNNITIDKGNKLLENHEGIQYLWLKTKGYKTNGIDRLRNTFEFSISLLRNYKYISKHFNPDVIIASSPHPFIFFGARRIAKYVKNPLVFEVRDLWPLSMIELHGISKKHPFMQIMQWTENYCYRKSDAIASVLPYAHRYYRDHGAKKSITYLPNSINIDQWGKANHSIPRSYSETLRKAKNDGKFIFGYTGTVGVANALEPMIESANTLSEKNILFVIVGEGDQLNMLKEMCKMKKLKNVLFIPKISKDQIPDMLSYMDGLYLGWKNSSLYQYGVSPNKLMDYLMAGKPIIHAISSDNDLVKDYNAGISIAAEDPIELSSAIIKLMNMPKEERDKMGENGVSNVVLNHSYETTSEKYLNLIEALHHDK